MHFRFTERLSYFLNFGYLHGIRYLGQRISYSAKFYWTTILVASIIGMAYIFALTYNRYNKDSVNINLDTAYIHWMNTFPAVSACVARSSKLNRIKAFIKSHLLATNQPLPKKEHMYYKLVRDYVFVTPITPIDPLEYCLELNSTCGINLEVLQTELFPKTCSDFMLNLTYMGREIENCEDLFKMHRTELGVCFIANSIYDYHANMDLLPLKFSRTNRRRSLTFKFNLPDTIKFDMYVHSPDELPSISSLKLDVPGSDYERHFYVETIEMFNSIDVLSKTIEQRQCRFPGEQLPNWDWPYSFSSCLTRLRTNLELEMCNCTMHTAPIKYKQRYCDYHGLICIRNANISMQVKEIQYTRSTPCLQSCIGMEVNANGNIEYKSDEKIPSVQINILNSPTIRYVRNVVLSSLDLVVSIGGVAGLFFGASLLSIIEFIYIWLIRQF